MRVLLAIDNSKFSEAVLRMAISQNRPRSTQVRVIHVVEPIETFSYMEMPVAYVPNLEDVRQERLKQAQALVLRVAKRLRTAGFKAGTDVREGNVRTQIVDQAARWKADLVLVGSHGLKGVERFLLGSVSEYVARHAPCSVEIVRVPARRRRKR